MLEIWAKGVAIGLAVAAPVGPIGLLCIKRTLAGGWRAGFATGLGVASADASYGVLVAAGFGFSGVLVDHATLMQIAGGLMIAALGLVALRTFRRAQLAEQQDGLLSGARPALAQPGRGLGGAFTSGYALTLSNPMTILAFTALVAGLGAGTGAQKAAPYLLVAGVFCGSAAWWALLATGASLARSLLTPALTRWLDLASGLVLLVWGLWLAFAAARG